MKYSYPAPDLPERPQSSARIRSLVRGLIAHHLCRTSREAEDYVKRTWDDRGALDFLKQRAAVTPMSMGAPFSQGVVQSVIDILGPSNAAAAVFARAVKVTFGVDDREASIWVPGLSSDGSKIVFVGQGNPLRNVQYDSSKGCAVSSGMKLGFSITLSSELLSHSAAETILRQKMIEDIGAGIDALLFGNAAASAGVSPAGLLNGVQTVAASTATGLDDALNADLAGLASAVGNIGGPIIYIGNIKEVTKIKARLPLFENVFASGAISTGNLLAVACRGIVVAGSDRQPEIDVHGESVVVMDDALTTAQLSTSPGVFGAPAVSLFQSDLQAVRLLFPDLTWGQRVAAGSGGAVAMLSGALKW